LYNAYIVYYYKNINNPYKIVLWHSGLPHVNSVKAIGTVILYGVDKIKEINTNYLTE